jgi:hypothetical protein
MLRLWSARKSRKRIFRLMELGSVTGTTKGDRFGLYDDGGDPPFYRRPH